MKFQACSSRERDSRAAVEEALAGMDQSQFDLVVLFLTAHHRGSAIAIADAVRERLSPAAFVGCTCEGVIGPDDEIEQAHGLSVLAAKLPGVQMTPFHVMPSEWPALLGDPDSLSRRVGLQAETRGVILLGDPFSCPVEELLPALDTLAPGVKVLGGMASGASKPWDNALLMNDELHTDGLVGFSVSGDIVVESVVSQGCRPIGERMLVTDADGPLLKKLGGQNALDALRKQLEALSEEEDEQVQRGLCLGVAVSEYREDFRRGDFLIRNLMGVDPSSGAIAVGDALRPGQTVQLHVRDEGSAHDDLKVLLEEKKGAGAPAGALVFSCNGRGTRMFEEPGHDVRTLQDAFPGIPAAGFFAMGEIGPVQNRTCLHGHTASIALFRKPK